MVFLLGFFKVKVVGGVARHARVKIFKLYLIVLLYSGFLCFLLSFKFKSVGGGPTASNFLSTATKSHQKMPQP